MLATDRYGTATDHPPLLIAHGLFGSARNWGVISKRLSDRGEVVASDMRNHGDSHWSDSHRYEDLADDLAALELGRTDVVGHSMGGKAAMMLALRHPEAVRRLVVADISPVAYGHSQGHLIDAMRKIDPTEVPTRSDADKELARDIDDPGVRAFLLQSLDLKEKRWRLNFDVLADEMDHITGWPGITGRFEGPALFLAGGASDYVQPDHRDEIKALFPNARFAKLPGAGHWLHAEKPRDFEAAVRVFLDAERG